MVLLGRGSGLTSLDSEMEVIKVPSPREPPQGPDVEGSCKHSLAAIFPISSTLTHQTRGLSRPVMEVMVSKTTVLSSLWVFVAIAFVFVGLRLYTRLYLIDRHGPDDFAYTAGSASAIP